MSDVPELPTQDSHDVGSHNGGTGGALDATPVAVASGERSLVRVVLFGLALSGVMVATLVVSDLWVPVGIVVGLLVAVVAHEAGHYVVAKRAGMRASEFFVGFGPRIWSFHRGGTEWGVKLLLLGGYVRIHGMTNLEELDLEEEPSSYRAQPARWRLAVALAGISVNIVLAFVLAVIGMWGQGVDGKLTTTVSSVVENMPGAKAGLQPGDRIVSIGDRPVTSFADAQRLIANRGGETTSVVVSRRGLERQITVVPKKADGGAKIGFNPTVAYRSVGPLGAVVPALNFQARVVSGTVGGLVKLFSPAGVTTYARQVVGANSGQEAQRAEEERPRTAIGIVSIGNTLIGGSVWRLLLLLSLLNVFLAVFNLIPLLPFDGGHAVVAAFEGLASKVSGRDIRVDQRRLLPLSVVVFGFLILLGVSAAFLDLRELLGG